MDAWWEASRCRADVRAPTTPTRRIPGNRDLSGENVCVVSSPVLQVEEPRWYAVRRWLVVAVFGLVLVFYAGGGWYFSGEIRREALEVRPSEPTYDLDVVAADDHEVTLRPVGDADPTLTRPGIFGLSWPGGYARVGAVVAEDGGQVTRGLVDGPAPPVGVAATLDPFAFDGDPRSALGVPFRDVVIPGPLGDLPAWWILGSRDYWVIQIHGKGSSREEALRTIPVIRELGYPQLVITYRNDPEAPSDPSGFYRYGATEWEDLAAAVDFAVERGAEKVILIGYSTGASIAASYMLRTDDPMVIAGAVYDAPNLDMGATIDFGASQRNLPLLPLPVPGSLAEVAKFFAALRYDVNWELLDYAKLGGQVRAPVLVFHGLEDDTVPIETSREFANRQPNFVRLVEVPFAGHVQSWNVDSELYENVLADFLRFEIGG